MNKTVYIKPLWYKEWRDLGFECMNGSQTIPLNTNLKNRHFKEIKKQHDHLLKKAKTIKNLKTYFQSYPIDNNEILCLADFIFHAFFYPSDFSNPDIKEKIFDKFIHFQVDELREDTLRFLDFRGDCINSIRRLTIDDEAKLDLIETIYHPQKMIQGLFDIYDQFQTIYQSLSFDENLFHNTQNIDDVSLQKFIEQIGLKPDHTPLSIYPSFINYQKTILMVEDYHHVLLIGIGLENDSLNSYHKLRNEQQKLEYFLKLLSDKSKLEILTLLKNKSMYGNELAKAMHLKTPTISYHMDALIDGNLVHIKKENNRIYYSLNTKEIESMIQYLHHKLLRDES